MVFHTGAVLLPSAVQDSVRPSATVPACRQAMVNVLPAVSRSPPLGDVSSRDEPTGSSESSSSLSILKPAGDSATTALSRLRNRQRPLVVARSGADQVQLLVVPVRLLAMTSQAESATLALTLKASSSRRSPSSWLCHCSSMLSPGSSSTSVVGLRHSTTGCEPARSSSCLLSPLLPPPLQASGSCRIKNQKRLVQM